MAEEPNGFDSSSQECIGKETMNNISDTAPGMEVSPVTILPHEIIEQLAELDLELSEGNLNIYTTQIKNLWEILILLCM